MMSGKFFKKTVRDVPLEGKTVVVRADYNVPLIKGKISDDFRIRQSLATLRYLREQGCKIVIMSHLGRPDGAIAPTLSLEPIAERLSELLELPVAFVPDCIGDRALQAAKRLRAGEIVLFENLRFHEGEEKNDPDFAHQLAQASTAEYLVQDGFGVVHRAHASTAALAHELPAVAGLLLEKECTTISEAMSAPHRPLVAVLGGAKISDKITIIERFVAIADTIIIGGAMANTFLDYKGYKIGKSIFEPDLAATMDKIYAAAAEKVGNDKVDDFIVLPSDVAVGTALEATARRTVVATSEVTDAEYILDLGTQSIERACELAAQAKTVIWNGTLGYAELAQFSHGSARMALTLAQHPDTLSVIGGGDTADFVLKWDAQKGKSFSHVSTGGGASLDLMAGKKLPGVEALMDSMAS